MSDWTAKLEIEGGAVRLSSRMRKLSVPVPGVGFFVSGSQVFGLPHLGERLQPAS